MCEWRADVVSACTDWMMCRSSDVIISPEQVQVYIDKVDKNDNKTIEKSEFAHTPYTMFSLWCMVFSLVMPLVA